MTARSCCSVLSRCALTATKTTAYLNLPPLWGRPQAADAVAAAAAWASAPTTRRPCLAKTSRKSARNAVDWKPLRNHNGSKEDLTVPTNLTLKNIPDEVYTRLKAAAALHRRSLNGEAIVSLEAVLVPGRAMADERLARARELRAGLAARKFEVRDVDAFKRQGRA